MTFRRWKTLLITVLKYGVALLLLGFVFYKIGLEQVTQAITSISLPYWVAALVMGGGIQVLGAYRMRHFFIASGVPMTSGFAIVLTCVGGFFNLILPGGVGGDAYKVWLARTRMELPVKAGIRLMIADRASGLCMVMLYFFAFLPFSDVVRVVPYASWLAVAGALLTLGGYVVCSQILLKLSARVMLGALPYSFLVQAACIGAMGCLWLGIPGASAWTEYVLLYCIGAVAAVLPISPGGLGLREIAYYKGAYLINQTQTVIVDAGVGVTLSLCLFLILVAGAIPGLFWLDKVKKASFAVQKPEV